MTTYDYEKIEGKLNFILAQMEAQLHLSTHYLAGTLPLVKQLEQIKEYIFEAGEYGLAYELIVVNLEAAPFILDGHAAVALLELGLIMRFKTEREEDIQYDLR